MATTSHPRVSVIIPVRDESRRIRQCIEGILNQTIPIYEIIVIDSGSSDGTLEILREFPEVSLIEIDGSTFNHGLTRNLGVKSSSGDFCLLTVGDAYPFNEHWVQNLLDGFIDDEVLAVCGQQVVDHLPENNPAQWFRPQSEPSIRKLKFSAEQWRGLKPMDKKKAIGWDDVNAMYRRDALVQSPFKKTSYSEDLIWAYDALALGKAIAYNYEARVFHYHNENAEFAYKRALTACYFRYKLTGYMQEPISHIDFIQMLRWLKSILIARYFNPRTILKWMMYNINRRNATVKAIAHLNEAIINGERYLDDFHQNACGKPPIPSKK